MELLWLVSEDANDDIAAQLQLDRESLSFIGWTAILGALLEGSTEMARAQ